jgi:hypothetical protein
MLELLTEHMLTTKDKQAISGCSTALLAVVILMRQGLDVLQKSKVRLNCIQSCSEIWPCSELALAKSGAGSSACPTKILEVGEARDLNKTLNLGNREIAL